MTVVAVTIYIVVVDGAGQQSKLFFRGKRVQWGAVGGGLPKATHFGITNTGPGLAFLPTRTLSFTPIFPGGVLAPDGSNGSEWFDVGERLPVPGPGEAINYTYTRLRGECTISQEPPVEESDLTYALALTSSKPEETCVVQIVMTSSFG